MKKRFGIFASLLSLATLVSAENRIAQGLGKGMSQLIEITEKFLSPFLSVILGGGPDVLFEKILFLVVIFSIVFLVIKQMSIFAGKENKVIVWIVSVSVSLLATRFLSGDLLTAVILPYGALGVAITAILPLFIMFQFLMKTDMPAAGRKMAWAFYIVIFVTLWSTRYNQLQIVANIYLGGAIIAFLFLVFDGTIKDRMGKRKAELIASSQDSLQRSKIQQKIDHIIANARLTEEEKDRLIRPLKRTLKKYYKVH